MIFLVLVKSDGKGMYKGLVLNSQLKKTRKNNVFLSSRPVLSGVSRETD